MSNDDKKAEGIKRKVDRRAFLLAAGAGAISASVPGATAQAAMRGKWDAEADVVVVGSGAAAGAAASKALQMGCSVIVIEKSPVWGGTTAKSGGVAWIPNNSYMRKKGLQDPRDDSIRLMARCSYPSKYRSGDKHFGLSDLEYDLLATYYDRGSVVIDELDAMGALKSQMVADDQGNPAFFDYSGNLPENKAPQGRAVFPVYKKGVSPGLDMTLQLRDFISKKGGKILLGHRAVSAIVNNSGQVIGVEVQTTDGKTKSIRARRGLVFGSGGFTHNENYRNNFLRGPIFGGCAVPTNEGDFIGIAGALGAQMGNLNNAWWGQVVVEQALQTPSVGWLVFVQPGKSLFTVNRHGRRVGDEQMMYNERTQSHFVWDPDRYEFSNRVQFMIFDQATRDENAGWYPIPAAGAGAPYLLQSDSLEGLAIEISQRLLKLAPQIGNIELAPNFMANLRETESRFAAFAANGVDADFSRGNNTAGLLASAGKLMGALTFQKKTLGDVADKYDTGVPNDSMRALSKTGPYYAILLGAGTLDTKGGPRINAKAQVLDGKGQPIRGLYGAGNCIASPAAAAYWSGGATIGTALAFGYIAGEQAASSAPIAA